MKKKSTRDKVHEIYNDKNYWKSTPPSVRSIAKIVGVHHSLVHKYVKELENKG